MSPPEGKRPTERDWLAQKPTLKKLWLDDSRKLMGKDGVLEVMATQHNFSASKWQYEKHFKDWKWSKNRSKDEWEQLAIVMYERKRQGKETNVYIGGELQSRDKIRKETLRYRPTINDRLSFGSTQQISQNITIRTPMLDKTDSLTVDLPFQHLENHLQLVSHGHGHQNMSWPNFPTVSSVIDPRLTYGADAENPYLFGNHVFNTELETFGQQQYYETSNTILTTSNIWKQDSSIFNALKSVVPKSIADEGSCGSSFRSTNTLDFASPLHRQILFSVANNFAGSDDFSANEIIGVLNNNIYGNLNQMIRSAQTYSSRAIIQHLFKVAIEAGNANIVDVLIRENPRDIKINKQFCTFQDLRYTPIEMATYLRHEDVVKCLLKHGADVNRTYSETWHTSATGALDHAVGHIRYYHDGSHVRVEAHFKIFQCLLDAGGDLSIEGMRSLFDLGGVELAVPLMSANTGRNAARWSEWGVFCRIAEVGDEHTTLEIVRIMLQYGADINYDVPRDNAMRSLSSTMIEAAAQRGYLRVVKLLLDSGASINGDTLPCAVASGDQDLVSLLLQRGADVKSCGSRKITPLAAAIEYEVTQVLNLIEDHGISARRREQDFSDLFQVASASAKIPLITQLIRRGCKVNLEDFDHALITATREGRTKVAKILIEAGADVNIRYGDHSESLLTEALRGRNETLVMSLLDADAAPNPETSHISQAVPIVLAAEWGNLSVIKNLIFAGAIVNHIQAKNGPHRDEDTALKVAVRRQDYQLVRFLLVSGVDINNRDLLQSRGPMFGSSECTALVGAAQNGDLEMARFLLDQGADPNDSVALFQATLKNKKIVDLLFEKYNARYPMGTRCFGAESLAKAIKDGNEFMVKLMLEWKVNANAMVYLNGQMASPFGFAIFRHQEVFIGCLELFLQNGCHPNDVISESRVYVGEKIVRLRTTAFLAAIGTRNTPTVELFISYGADVNFPTRGPVKRTPIQKAAEVGSLDILELLFNHGADINAPPAQRGGGTALQLAAINGDIRTACWLLSHGADPNEPGSIVNGRSALEGAAEHGRLDMVQLLLNGGAGFKQGDDIQVANAIELARTNGHYPICDLLEDYFSSRRDILPNGIDGNIPDLNLDEDFSDLVNFDF